MNFKSRLVKLWNGFEDLFFKNHACLLCRREIPDGTNFSLCKNCLESIEQLKGNICETCGDKILEDNKICDRCKSSKFSFDKSRSFSIYEDVSAKLVKRFKYSGKKYYAEHLAELMITRNECFENMNKEFDKEKEQLWPKKDLMAKIAQEGIGLGITLKKNESFTFLLNLLDLFDMLCSHRVLSHYGNVDLHHPAWSF